MSTATEKANLARIRDNQRRSRARRKEYLQELEARLRQYELQGIEASSEIQMAARRVAVENKKLRGLLTQNGVGGDSVEGYLQSSPTDDTTPDGQYGSNSGSAQLHHSGRTHRIITSATSNAASRTISISRGYGSGRDIPHHQRLGPVQMPQHSSQASNASFRNANLFEYPQLALSNATYTYTSAQCANATTPNEQPFHLVI